jgi:hypothetical protein
MANYLLEPGRFCTFLIWIDDRLVQTQPNFTRPKRFRFVNLLTHWDEGKAAIAEAHFDDVEVRPGK